MRRQSLDAPWRRAAVVTGVLVFASVVPSPLPRHRGLAWRVQDKFLHLVGHAGHTVTLADAIGAAGCSDRDAAIVGVCASTALGIVTGRLQTRVPGREPERADVVAGLLGSLLAASGWYRVASWRP